MRLQLTAVQIEQLRAHLHPETTLIARVTREVFDGTNVATCGTPFIEFGTVPTSSLPSLRESIRVATTPATKRKANK